MLFKNLLTERVNRLLVEFKMSKTEEEVNVIRQEQGIKFTTDKGHPTQRANTVATYRKFWGFIGGKHRSKKGLDYSAGLGYGSQALRDEEGADIDSYEIHPHESAVGLTYSGEGSLPTNNKYEYIICSAVLNVLPQDIRDRVVLDIFEHLEWGGVAIIGVRSRADVLSMKTGYVIDQDTAEVLDRSRGSYQKGFTPNELKKYIEELLPQCTVANLTGLSQVAVMVFKQAYNAPDYTSPNEDEE